MVSSSPPAEKNAPVALTVAGSDSGANAGAQADLLTFAANQVYGASVITCLTAQNPTGVRGVGPTGPELVEQQLAAIGDFYTIRAAKTGMLFSTEIIEVAARFFAEHPEILLVVDPVMVASSGDTLLQTDAIESIKNRLLPKAAIITPNLDEAEILCEFPLADAESMDRAALEMARRFNATVLLKGGHLKSDRLVDVVADPEGGLHRFEQQRIHTIDTHGSGCTLSAAIAAQLAQGEESLSAISIARHYLRRCMLSPVYLSGKPFINHFPV